MEIPSLAPFLIQAVEKHHPAAAALSDDLASHPELSGQEFRSSRKIVELLRQAGYHVEYPYLGCPTGFRAVLDRGEGPSAAILTEYDALPGLGHACGHNVHGSMSVLAALALAEIRDKFQGKVCVFGTPAEEADGAKVGMAEQGAFDGMALASMIHSWSGGECLPDMDVLSLRCYLVEFRGVAAHSVGAPWKGHSALAAARKFLDLIDARRECFTPDIYVNSVILDGGRQPNILPDRSEVRLEFRTGSRARLEEVDGIISKCARGAALALDCQVSFSKCFDDFADMVRVPVLEQAAAGLFAALGRTCGQVQRPDGSSDVGNVSYRCPTIQAMVSICDEFYPLHSAQFSRIITGPAAHRAIADGGTFLAALTLRVLTDAAFREEVQASFLAQRKEKLG